MGVKDERMLHVTLLLLLMSPHQVEPFIFSAIMTAVSFAYQAYSIINDAHDTYKKFAPQTTLDDVLDQVQKVESKVDKIGAQLSNQIGQAVNTIVTRIDDLNNIRDGMMTLSRGVRRIDSLYRLFELYSAKKIRLNNHTLQDYIQQVTTIGALAPKDILGEIYELIIPSSGLRESFLYYITKDLPGTDSSACGGSSPQTKIYQIFRLIMVNEIRTFTMLAFAYAMNQVYQCESFEGEIEYAEYELQSRAREYYDVFMEVSNRTAGSIRSCDPSGGWIKGKNFYEFERFNTKYVVNARAFDEDAGDDCERGCGKEGAKLEIEWCDEKLGCYDDTSCWGGLDSCVLMESPTTVCQLGSTGPRYQFYYSEDDGTRGDDSGGCKGSRVTLKSYGSCDLCQCSCLEDTYRTQILRTFSTRIQLSDAANNKAVTGVRFVVKEHMTHIQIQQGEVLPEGRIEPKSVEWLPLEDIKFDEDRTKSKKEYSYILDYGNGSVKNMYEINDFISLTRTTYMFYIDDLIVPLGYIVTGAKFLSTGIREYRQPIRLAIQASPFDYDTGKIEITKDNPSIWLTSDKMAGRLPEYDEKRSEHVIADKLNPLTQTGRSFPSSSPNTYIKVSNTDAKTDAGQTTIPLMDVQDVAGRPAFAAAGIGIYYRSMSDEVGGFIGLRLFALDPMANLEIALLDTLDQFKEGVTEFKGCNNDLGD